MLTEEILGRPFEYHKFIFKLCYPLWNPSLKIRVNFSELVKFSQKYKIEKYFKEDYSIELKQRIIEMLFKNIILLESDDRDRVEQKINLLILES